MHIFYNLAHILNISFNVSNCMRINTTGYFAVVAT